MSSCSHVFHTKLFIFKKFCPRNGLHLCPSVKKNCIIILSSVYYRANNSKDVSFYYGIMEVLLSLFIRNLLKFEKQHKMYVQVFDDKQCDIQLIK